MLKEDSCQQKHPAFVIFAHKLPTISSTKWPPSVSPPQRMGKEVTVVLLFWTIRKLGSSGHIDHLDFSLEHAGAADEVRRLLREKHVLPALPRCFAKLASGKIR